MINTHPVSVSAAFPIPQDLNAALPNHQTPWNISFPVFQRIIAQNSDQPFKICEILNSDPEFNFILKYFEHHKPSNYSIKRIVCIHNPTHTQVFEGTLKNIELECNNPVFVSKGKEEHPKIDRARALNRWEKQVIQFSPVEIQSTISRIDYCFKAKVLPLWHGSSEEVCKSVCSSGFTSFGKHHYFDESAQKGNNKSTDKGYFGSGIYFTNSAQYASMYSQGHLLMAWVSMREPYPVVSDVPHPNKCTDMLKLGGKEHYQNYNAHYIPVASINPHDPKCVNYYPCYKDQPPAWDEFVVFQNAQTLPRFWIELAVDFPFPVYPLPSPADAFSIKPFYPNSTYVPPVVLPYASISMESAPPYLALAFNPAGRGRALIKAIEDEKIHIIQQLLSQETDLNIKDGSQRTVLYIACSKNNIPIIQLLIFNGARIDGEDAEAALISATDRGALEVVKMLVYEGVSLMTRDPDVTKKSTTFKETSCRPLEIAAEKGHLDLIRFFLSTQNLPNGLQLHAYQKIFNSSFEYMRKTVGHYAFLLACKNGHFEAVWMLLQSGVNLDDKIEGNSYSQSYYTLRYYAFQNTGGNAELYQFLKKYSHDGHPRPRSFDSPYSGSGYYSEAQEP